MPTPDEIAEALLHSARDIVARVSAMPDVPVGEGKDRFLQSTMGRLAWGFALAADDYCGNEDLQRVMAGKAYLCPACHRVSHHPKDLEHRYCAACHIAEQPDRPLMTREAFDSEQGEPGENG